MNWIPPIFNPICPYMVALIVLWYLAITIALHRFTRSIRWQRINQRWHQSIDSTMKTLRTERRLTHLTGPIEGMVKVLREEPSPAGLERFHRGEIGIDQAPDRVNDRWCRLIISIAPLVGLVGTADGLLQGFRDVAAVSEAPTIRDLATPMASALTTTIHGALCAVFCLVIRSSLPVTDLHQQTNRAIAVAWEALMPRMRRKNRRKATNEDTVREHAMRSAEPPETGVDQ